LLDWYLNWYVNNDPGKRATQKNAPIYPALTTDPDIPNWRLTVEERKRILLTHIFGVDIDPQAVEVTRLSLLLKVLEDEQSIPKQLSLEQERVLPDLDQNIKCGNSLIGWDFFDGRQMGLGLFDEEERYRVNPFDWQTEFPEVMQAGGFDAVVGNPPYGAQITSSETNYVRERFKDTSNSFDSYELFLIQAARVLKKSGRFSMIIPSSWLTGQKYVSSRKFLISTLAPSVAYAMPFDVFKTAYIDTAIAVFTHSKEVEDCLIHYFPKKEKLTTIPDDVGKLVPIPNIQSDSEYRFSVIHSRQIAPIISKLKESGLTFGDWFDIQRGVQPYSRQKHSKEQIKEKFLHADLRLTDEYLPELQGKELSRYYVDPQRTSFIRYCSEIASIRQLRMFQGERVVLRRLLTRKFRLQASLAKETMITTDNVLNLVPCNSDADVPFALGILNSRLISWFYVNISMIAQKDDFPQVHISALSSLTIPVTDKTRHDNLDALVEQMLTLHQQLTQPQTPPAKTVLHRQIEATDRQIDKLVYELYGLTAEEIKIVEGQG
ncbi:MAG: Eco57I restriction-modification methylase domain-containing protein, partial [Anaerolineae bacterium]|nr:Eco57I restriction-modification methylase domain-containing protein [Anaerolineae bacterium]